MAKNIEPHVSSMEQVTIIGSNSVQSTTNRVLCIFTANCGPLEPTEVENQSDFLAKYTDGGEISRSSHRSFFHALKHSQSLPLLCVRVSSDRITKGISSNGDKVYTKGKYLLNYNINSMAFTLTLAKTNGPSGWVIVIGDYIFAPSVAVGGTEYTKLYNSSLTSVSIDPENSAWPDKANVAIGDLEYFFTQVKNYIIKYTNYSIQITVGADNVTINNIYSETLITTANSFTVIAPVGTQIVTTAFNFVISPNYPCTTNLFTANINNVSTYTVNGVNYYRFILDITFKGVTSSYQLSTYPDDTDATGNNMYLTSFNELNSDLTLIPVNDSSALVALDDKEFGATDTVTTYDKDTIPLSLLNQAIADVEDLEGIRISILSDCGLCIPAYQKRLTVLAETLHALPTLSTPDNPLPAYVERYVNNVGLDTSYAWWGFPWNTDKSLVNFPVDLSPICYYIERVAANASGNQEFAPVFGKQTGVSTAKNLHANPKLAIRNELQTYGINPMHYVKSENICYFTNDLTALSQLTVLQEEQTRRLINKIRYEVDLLCQSYLSYDWDQASCDKIKEGIKNYFTNNILKMLRTIDGDPVITVALAGLNKVRIDISVKPKGSIKYIQIYYNILSVAA